MYKQRGTYRQRAVSVFDLSTQPGPPVQSVSWIDGPLFWGSTNDSSSLTTTKDVIIFPGMSTYTVDLGSLTDAPDGGIHPAGSRQLWNAAPIKQFRIDPHEFGSQKTFHFDDVKLAALDEAFLNFVITFNGSDPDIGDTPTVSLFYDTNTDPTDGRMPIVSNLPLSAGQYEWNTTATTPGTYFLSADVTDGLDTRTFHASGALRVTGGADPPPPTRGDDVALDWGSSGGASGLWVLYNNGPNAPVGGGANLSRLHTLSPDELATGDLDGTLRDDLIAEFPGAGVWVCYNNADWVQLHPSGVSQIVTGDLDGNGREDVLFDFPGAGIWVWLNNSSWFQLHPMSPGQMVTGDLDGNGMADAIIDFPGFGVWIYANNGDWSQLHPLSPNQMMTGDLDGSGAAEAVIDFPGFGIWVYANNSTWSPLHPLSPNRFVAGDLDANGRADAIVDFPGLGIWAFMDNSVWVQLRTVNAEDMTTGDIDGNGRADVIFDFGATGIWAWVNNTNFIQLHTQSPDGMASGNLDGI